MDDYIRKLLILQFTKMNLMKNLLLISLIFLFSCKKETVTPPVISPVINTDSVIVHLISGGECPTINETSIQINSITKLYSYSVDTIFKAKKGDTIIIASWNLHNYNCTSENWVMINDMIDSSETTPNFYSSARLEYIIK